MITFFNQHQRLAQLNEHGHFYDAVNNHQRFYTTAQVIELNTALFDWLLFTQSGPTILSARHFRRSAI